MSSEIRALLRHGESMITFLSATKSYLPPAYKTNLIETSMTARIDLFVNESNCCSYSFTIDYTIFKSS